MQLRVEANAQMGVILPASAKKKLEALAEKDERRLSPYVWLILKKHIDEAEAKDGPIQVPAEVA